MTSRFVAAAIPKNIPVWCDSYTYGYIQYTAAAVVVIVCYDLQSRTMKVQRVLDHTRQTVITFDLAQN